MSRELVGKFEDFYADYCDDQIAELAQRYPRESESLFVEYRDLYQFDPTLAEDYRYYPDEYQGYAKSALQRYDLPVVVEDAFENASVRLTDSSNVLTRHSVTGLSKDDIGTVVAIEGQLSRITGKSPRLDTAVYDCQRCGVSSEVPQTRTEVSEPHECQGCDRQGPFQLNASESEWVDQRKVKLEEPIEERSQSRGQSLPVYVEGDLCDRAPGSSTLPDHAGERATVVGVVRVDESQLTGRNADPETELWVDATAIIFDGDDEGDIDVEVHREEFEGLASHNDAVDKVAESIAPSLHADPGDDLHTARRACAAWLFNAYRADPDGSGSKRGDMHMCLIGDPGTGKSSLMGYLHDICPKSEFRSGTGLNEVGLTAAAVQEEFAGTTEWTLQPGILPRSNGGHCLIDEIDGVVDEDTKAIHDALEGEQMVKTDKAGIKADLPTRTALLAGGNPVYTRFDKYEPITEQIDLDPALFDRMDLVFALQDEVDEERDAKKAAHALDAWDDLSRAEVAARTDSDIAEDGDTVDPAVPKPVLRAWVKFARENVFPTLTESVKDRLKQFYVEVRDLNDGHGSDDDSAVPATPRTLEAGIRLSIAFARLRLSDTVELEDADRAIELTKEVVGLNYDPETGEFDDRRTRKGTPQSQKERRELVKSLIVGLEGESPVDVDAVIEAGVGEGLDEEQVVHCLEKLANKGDIYYPQSGGVRTT